jgi:plasmid stabilization system protein ParE
VTWQLTPEADAEPAEAVRFYATQVSGKVAHNFLMQFERKARLLTEFPDLGTPAGKSRRLLPIGRYPYSILYRVDAGVVRISAIAAHARRPGYWQARKP